MQAELACPGASGATAAVATGPGGGESGEDRVQAGGVVAVARDDADRGEVLSGRPDPVHDRPAVLSSEAGVD